MFKLKAAAVCAALFTTTVFTGCSKKAVVEKNLGPAETITWVSGNLADGNTEEAYVCLPKSYREDISTVVHKVGEKMPAEVWDKSFELLGRLGKVLKSKKSFIGPTATQAAGPMVSDVNKQDMEKSIEAFGDMLVELSKSDIAKVNKLKSLDVQNYVGTSGKKIYTYFKTNPLVNSLSEKAGGDSSFSASLKKVKAELVSEKGNNATVKVTSPDGKTQNVELTKVEGKWIPAEMAEEMKTFDEDIKELDTMLDDVAKNKNQVVKTLSMIEDFIVSLEKSSNQQDIMTALQNSPAAMFLGGAPKAPTPPPIK